MSRKRNPLASLWVWSQPGDHLAMDPPMPGLTVPSLNKHLPSPFFHEAPSAQLLQGLCLFLHYASIAQFLPMLSLWPWELQFLVAASEQKGVVSCSTGSSHSEANLLRVQYLSADCSEDTGMQVPGIGHSVTLLMHSPKQSGAPPGVQLELFPSCLP